MRLNEAATQKTNGPAINLNGEELKRDIGNPPDESKKEKKTTGNADELN